MKCINRINQELSTNSSNSMPQNGNITTEILNNIIDNEENIEIVVPDDIIQHLSKVCRCCLAERNDLQNLFGVNGKAEGVGDGRTTSSRVAEMIMAFAAVQVDSNDLLPSKICVQCVGQVTKTLAFKQQIETVDATLRHYISNGQLSALSIDEAVADTAATITDEDPVDNEEIYCEISLLPQNIDETIIGKQSPNRVVKNSTDVKQESESFNETIEYFDSGNEYTIHENDIIIEEELHTEKLDTVSQATISKNQKQNETENENTKIQKLCMLNLAKKKRMLKRKSLNEENNKSKILQRWTCTVCKKKFPDIRRLNRHKKIHQKDKPYYCSTCNKGFNERTDLHRHIARHTRLQDEEVDIKYSYNCSDCHMGFTVERDLKIHSSIHNSKDGRHFCTECGKEFSSSTQIKRHVRTHFEDKPHKCRVCLKGFSEMGSLTRHFRRHTGEQLERKHACKFCGKKYHDTYSLTVHVRTHTGEKPWICQICQRGFIDSRLLNSHMKVHSNERPFACSVCDKRFTHQSTLTTHARTHTGEKPYVCTVCGKTFIQSSNLSLHMRVHSGERPYNCMVCGRSFASSSTLTMHIRIHTGEKPFNCNICNKSFARHDLTVHMRTHTGEKPFVCQHCSKRFITSGQLNQHIRTHTNEKPFVCNVCHHMCSTAYYLKKHKRLHAADNEVKLLPTDKKIIEKLHIQQQLTDEVLLNEVIDDDVDNVVDAIEDDDVGIEIRCNNFVDNGEDVNDIEIDKSQYCSSKELTVSMDDVGRFQDYSKQKIFKEEEIVVHSDINDVFTKHSNYQSSGVKNQDLIDELIQ